MAISPKPKILSEKLIAKFLQKGGKVTYCDSHYSKKLYKCKNIKTSR